LPDEEQVKRIKQRVEKLRRELQANRMEALLVTCPENIRYLSGFTGGRDARLLITLDKKYIITDSRYYTQVSLECPGWELVRNTPGAADVLIALSEGFASLGFESSDLTYDRFLQMQAGLKPELLPAPGLVEKLRLIKEEIELELLRTAARIGDQVFTAVCQQIKAGMQEAEIANLIVTGLKNGGCSREAFETIAVAGVNAALPHGQPGDYRLQPGDMLTMDFGGLYQGYAGDMTRTVAIHHADTKLRDAYRQLLEAQELGVGLVQAGMAGRELDQKVRAHLQKYQLDGYFVHSTGHGLGLAVHEAPRLSASSQDILQENMAVTVEPGIYIPGWGGIRIEDTVIVKKGGCEVITHSDKGLLII